MGRGAAEAKTGESPGKSQQKARVQSHHQAEDVVRGISLPITPLQMESPRGGSGISFGVGAPGLD